MAAYLNDISPPSTALDTITSSSAARWYVSIITILSIHVFCLPLVSAAFIAHAFVWTILELVNEGTSHSSCPLRNPSSSLLLKGYRNWIDSFSIYSIYLRYLYSLYSYFHFKFLELIAKFAGNLKALIGNSKSITFIAFEFDPTN